MSAKNIISTIIGLMIIEDLLPMGLSCIPTAIEYSKKEIKNLKRLYKFLGFPNIEVEEYYYPIPNDILSLLTQTIPIIASTILISRNLNKENEIEEVN